MIVVVAGMVGVDKKSYLQKVCELAASRGKNIVLCNVGDEMYAEALDIPRGSKTRPSVFVTQTATKVFPNAETAAELFRQKMAETDYLMSNE